MCLHFHELVLVEHPYYIELVNYSTTITLIFRQLKQLDHLYKGQVLNPPEFKDHQNWILKN